MTNSLQNLRILVTRSPEQAGDLSGKLQARGATTIEVPVISIEPPRDWSEIDACLDRIDSYDWMIFASANAVRYLIERIIERDLSPQMLNACKIACIGTATVIALEAHDLIADFCPSKFLAESLIEEFPGYPDLQGKRFFWPKTNIGRSYIADKLREAGADVDAVVAYITTEPANRAEIQQQLSDLIEHHKIDVITLASAQSARNLASLFGSPIPQDIAIATIGPETSKAAAENLGRFDIQADPHTMDGIVSAIENHLGGPGHLPGTSETS